MSEVLLLLSTFAWCALGGVFPILSAEVLLISASALSSKLMVLPLIVAGTAGSMAGKAFLFWSARLGEDRWSARGARRLDAVLEKLRRQPRWNGALVLSSAASGLPPFYPMTIAAGILKMRLIPFVLLGAIGLLVRYSLVVVAPQFFKGGL